MMWKPLAGSFCAGLLVAGTLGAVASGNLWWAGRTLETEREAYRVQVTRLLENDRLHRVDEALCDAERAVHDQNFGVSNEHLDTARALMQNILPDDTALQERIDALRVTPGETGPQAAKLRAASAAVGARITEG